MTTTPQAHFFGRRKSRSLYTIQGRDGYWERIGEGPAVLSGECVASLIYRGTSREYLFALVDAERNQRMPLLDGLE